MSFFGKNRTCGDVRGSVATEGEADISRTRNLAAIDP
jgi:hypothetical protein